MVVKNFAKIEFLDEVIAQFVEDIKFDLDRNGYEYRCLLVCGLKAVKSCLFSARQRVEDYQRVGRSSRLLWKSARCSRINLRQR